MIDASVVYTKNLHYLQTQYNREALDIALTIGLLTPKKLKDKQSATFSVAQLRLKGERSLTKGVQSFRLWDSRTGKIIFDLELQKKSPMNIIEFKRGNWEHLLHKQTEGINEKTITEEPRKRLKHRIRKPKTGNSGEVRGR